MGKMPDAVSCEVSWFEKPHIILIRAKGDLTAETIRYIADETIALTQSVPMEKVFSLVDASEVRSIPNMPLLIQELRRIAKEAPNRDISVAYGVSRAMRYFLDVMTRLTPLRVRVFESEAQAVDFLRQVIASQE